MLAAHETTIAAVTENPDLHRYVNKWGRVGDSGYIAEFRGKSIGAAWCRLWSATNKGYAFVDMQTPELAIAVLPEYRNQGIGRTLITKLCEKLSPNYQSLCLSVRLDNPGLKLYKSLGFVALKNSGKPNRVGGTSIIMVKTLA